MKDKEKQIKIKRGELVDLLNQEQEELQKAKTIEEMAEAVICAAILSNAKIDDKVAIHLREFVENLYNAGYRKLPEDNVVLSREEYNLLINIKKFFETADSEISAGNLLVYLKEFKEEERKETAEKILKAFEYCNDTTFYAKWLELCKQFGV